MTAPDRNDEYLLYQTLVGAWPLEPLTGEVHAQFVERIQQYMEKAIHEAKVHTSWINPNPAYDDAVRRVRRPASWTRKATSFLEDFGAFQQRVSHYGLFNSLSQMLLKIASPRRCPTSTRGRNCGTSAWWIRTTAGRWITNAAGNCCRN